MPHPAMREESLALALTSPVELHHLGKAGPAAHLSLKVVLTQLAEAQMSLP